MAGIQQERREDSPTHNSMPREATHPRESTDFAAMNPGSSRQGPTFQLAGKNKAGDAGLVYF